MARAQGARAQLALAFETTYGTAPASGFVKMPFATASLGAEQPLLASELLGYGRDPVEPIKDALTADGNVVVPLDAEAYGYWLKGAFGAPTTTEGTDDFEHVFSSGSWNLPSFSVEVGMPEVPSFAMYSGCMVDSFSWSMARSGLLTSTVEIVAQGEDLATSSQAGTPSTLALKRFGHFNGSVKRDGVDIGNIISAELNYQNNIDRVETIRADGKIEGADASIAAMTGSIGVRFADTTLLNQAIGGNSCALTFGYQLPTGETLTVSAPRVFLPRPRREITGPQGVQVTFDWQAAQHADGSPMVTVTLENAVETY